MADEATERITILLQAKDRDFARAMDRNNKLIAKFSRDAERNTTATTRRIDANLAGLAGSAAGLGKAFVTGLGAGVIGAVLAGVSNNIRQTIGDVADLGDQAARVGVDVESFQGLQRGFKLAGVEAASFSSGLEKFVENVGDAARGSTTFGSVLARNGIAIKNADGSIRGTTDLMRDFADVLSATPDEAERMSLITEAFGRGGKAMVLAMSEGSAGLDEMIRTATEGGYVLDSELIAKAQVLDDKFDNLTLKVGNFFKAVVVGAVDAIPSLEGSASQIERIRGLLDADMAEQLGANPNAATAESLGELEYAYAALTASARAAADAIGNEIPALLEFGAEDAALQLAELSDRLQQLVTDFATGKVGPEEFKAGLMDVTTEADITLRAIDGINGVDLTAAVSVVSGLGTILDGLVTKANAAAVAVRNAVLSQVSVPGNSFAGQDRAPPTTFAPETSIRPQMPGVDSFPAGVGAGGGRSGGGGGSNEMLREVERLYDATRTAAEKYAIELAEINALQAAGHLDAELYARAVGKLDEKFRGTSDTMAEMKDAGREVFVSLLTQAEDLGDVLESVASRLASFFANAAFESFTGDGGFLGNVAKALSGRSGGGGVRAGMPYRVNENTPNSEIMVPSRSGGVLNVAQARDALRGQAGGGGILQLQIGDGVQASWLKQAQGQAVQIVGAASNAQARQFGAAQANHAARGAR